MFILDQVPVTILRGPLLDEVHQNINSWIYQVVTLINIEELLQTYRYTCSLCPIHRSTMKEQRRHLMH